MVHHISSQKSSTPTIEVLVKSAVGYYRENPLSGFEPAARHAMQDHYLYADGKKGTSDYDVRMRIVERTKKVIRDENAEKKTQSEGKKFVSRYSRSAQIQARRFSPSEE